MQDRPTYGGRGDGTKAFIRDLRIENTGKLKNLFGALTESVSVFWNKVDKYFKLMS